MKDQEEQPKCPVDHSARMSWFWKAKEVEKEKVQVDQPKCPVDHNARSEWMKNVSVTTTTPTAAIEVAECASSNFVSNDNAPVESDGVLSVEREISSIPRTSGNNNWIYPSQKQFYEAMKRKNWQPDTDDMKTVVPIHNAVNEMAWQHILNWERTNYEESLKKCGGIKLTSFKGDSSKTTPRAWFNTNILGYKKPFDRHDWIVDRCGVEIEYVIDFYGGAGKGPGFYLDVRPKLNSWEGVKLRLGRSLGIN